MNRYISDLHLGHRNIIRYDNRPFDSMEKMEESIKALWNEAVKDTDTTYILGDVCWSANYDVWEQVLNELNGKKIIIKGNHDPTSILNKLKQNGVIEDWAHQIIVSDNGRHVVLNHSPMPFFVNQHKDNWYHLYGHTHISFDYQIIKSVRRSIEELYMHEHRMFNVGCMIPGMDYTPRTLDEIIAIDRKHKNTDINYMEKTL